MDLWPILPKLVRPIKSGGKLGAAINIATFVHTILLWIQVCSFRIINLRRAGPLPPPVTRLREFDRNLEILDDVYLIRGLSRTKKMKEDRR